MNANFSSPDEPEQIEARARLRRARESANKSPEELSAFVGNSTSTYYDLENCNGEIYMTLSLGELAAICSVVGIRPRELFTVIGHDNEQQSISPKQLISEVEKYLNKSGMTIVELEERVGFEVAPSLEDVSKVLDWNVDFLRWLCAELGLDWHLALPEKSKPSVTH